MVSLFLYSFSSILTIKIIKQEERNMGFHLFHKPIEMSKEDIAELLNTSPEALAAFEESYQMIGMNQETDNFMDISVEDVKEKNIHFLNINEKIEELSMRVVAELLAMSKVMYWKNGIFHIDETPYALPNNPVTLEEINVLPENLRPQLTGRYMQRDLKDDDGVLLFWTYREFLREKNQKKKQQWYHMFRQGLDIQDLNPLIYATLGKNQNSIENWFPQLCEGIQKQEFFKIPETTILQVPLPLLQLARLDYGYMTPTTLYILDHFCQEVFHLKKEKEYFVKTGIFSSKYDFRNAHVYGDKEVKELGEYLLFISNQACQMAGPLMHPCTYGPGTTRSWVVREYIKDTEDNPCIYKGMPLHTEYRVFVDFDTKELLGISPYWDPNIMKQRFGHADDADSPHNIHDYIIFMKHEEVLMKRYEENKERIQEHVKKLLPDIPLTGQWSMDIMQNGEDFYIIDMALAVNSALLDCVPKEKLKPVFENWLPEIS